MMVLPARIIIEKNADPCNELANEAPPQTDEMYFR